jgi:hypothetical protein
MSHRWITNTTVLAALALGPDAVAQTPPQSLQMGGAKSVTRFFITSRGLGKGLRRIVRCPRTL